MQVRCVRKGEDVKGWESDGRSCWKRLRRVDDRPVPKGTPTGRLPVSELVLLQVTYTW